MEQSGQLERVFTQIDDPHLLQTLESLDTVRALHQTVVALRQALESSQQEIEKLKKQINVQSDIKDGKLYKKPYEILETDKIEEGEKLIKNLSKDNNQRQVTFCGTDKLNNDKTLTTKQNETNIKSYDIERKSNIKHIDKITPASINKQTKFHSNIQINKIEDDTDEYNDNYEIDKKQTKKIDTHLSSQKKTKLQSSNIKKVEIEDDTNKYKKNKKSQINEKKDYSLKKSIVPVGNFTSYQRPMSSKIGLKIRVSSNIQMDSTSSSDIDSARSSDNSKPDIEKTINFDKTKEEQVLKEDENKKQSNLIISVTSDDENALKNNKLSSENITDTLSTSNLHLDVDNLSVNSLSEGDNSVFTEGPVEHPEASSSSVQLNENEKQIKTQTKNSTTSEHHDEVDDIELIFSSDDNKDIIQEDLVSISDYEPWQTTGESGTPILTKYEQLPQTDNILINKQVTSDNQEDNEKTKLFTSNNMKNSQDSTTTKTTTGNKQKSYESSDDLSYDKLNRSFDCNTKSSSLDKDYSLENEYDDTDGDGVQRDESFDKFDQGNNARLGQKWKNSLIETDISKCGITEENILEMGRRNTCPNPPPYRPIIHRDALAQSRQTSNRCPLAVKFSRSPRSQYQKLQRPILIERNTNCGTGDNGPKRSSSAQTEISALPEQWRSESHLAGGYCIDGFYTLPSKYVPSFTPSFKRYPLRLSDKTQEARRVLLSDINFTSMVPELSRSADHLCHDDEQLNNNNNENKSSGYYKGNLLKTPESLITGVTPSVSMTSPGVSQWTVNDNSYGTQTTQTEYWGNRGDSFDSCKSYSMGSKYSSGLSRHNRSRSVPSVRCAVCKQSHITAGMRTSESMHYTPRVTSQDGSKQSIRGSLPDLRHDCTCPRRHGGPSLYKIHGDSEESTESLLDEAEDFLRRSMDGILGSDSIEQKNQGSVKRVNRRHSENDIQRDYVPSKQSLPFLPKTSKCLKPGHLAKVISKNGRVVIGRIRYVGPLVVQGACNENESFVGLQLPNKFGDCDGSIEGRKFFDCEPLQGIFVPFKKVVMAWTS